MDYVCKTILMSATQAGRNLPTIPIFQIGTSSHNSTSYKHLHHALLDYWRTAKATSPHNSKIADNVQAVMYSSTKDFELQFIQRFSRELQQLGTTASSSSSSSQENGQGYQGNNNKEDQDKIRKRLLQAYKTPKLHSLFSSTQWVLDASNSVVLDALAPNELKSGLKSDGGWFDWDDYLYIYNRGLHEFILKEKVIKTTRMPPATDAVAVVGSQQQGTRAVPRIIKKSIQRSVRLDDGGDQTRLEDVQRGFKLLSRL